MRPGGIYLYFASSAPAVAFFVTILTIQPVSPMTTRRMRSRTFPSIPKSETLLEREQSPRVAIIGAGAAGLAAARAFHLFEPVILEQSTQLGGVWRYQEASQVHPMYRGLRTNLPKELMAYYESPFDDEATPASFVAHHQVLEYLQGYCSHFQLSPFIRFNTKVELLEVLPGTSSSFCPDWPRIRIQYRSISPENESVNDRVDSSRTATPSTLGSTSEVFDAVCICNGHYSLPFIPELPGLKDAASFGIRFLHSIAYDSPEAFSGERVLCVGGRASGSDIARELATNASAVYLSDSTYQRNEPWTEHGVTLLPRTVRLLPNNTVEFFAADGVGHSLTVQIDVILFCTGYDYHFPFIKPQMSNLQLQEGERRVAPLVEQLWHAQVPNVAFLGLPHSIVPFPLVELQAHACLHEWTYAGKDLPLTVEQRMRVANEDATAGGPGGSGRVQDTHYLGNAQWEYCSRLASRYAPHAWNADYEAYLRTNEVRACVSAKAESQSSGLKLHRFLDTKNLVVSSVMPRLSSLTVAHRQRTQTLYNHTSAARNGSPGLGFPAGPDLYRSLRYLRRDSRGIVEVTLSTDSRELLRC
jgi:thioredoxin reductase